MSSPAAPLIAWSRSFPASPPQISEARRFLATLVDGCPVRRRRLALLVRAGHQRHPAQSLPRPGGQFTVHARRHGNHLRVEVCDQGGPWITAGERPAGGQNGAG